MLGLSFEWLSEGCSAPCWFVTEGQTVAGQINQSNNKINNKKIKKVHFLTFPNFRELWAPQSQCEISIKDFVRR